MSAAETMPGAARDRRSFAGARRRGAASGGGSGSAGPAAQRGRCRAVGRRRVVARGGRGGARFGADSVPAARAGALLDCGDDAGAAQAALREGVEEIVFSGRDEVRERLADIARGRGSRVYRNRPPAALDLVDDFFAPPEALHRRVLAVLQSDMPKTAPNDGYG